MSAATTKLVQVCEVVQRTACSTTVRNRLVLRFPSCSHIPARRYLSAVPYLSPVPLSNTDVQDENLNRDRAPSNDISLSFKSLKDWVNHDTFRALTDHPLQLEAMTLVQERVLGLLPDLARPWGPEGTITSNIPKPLSPAWKPSVIDYNTPRDILVRAKPGVGNALAYIIPATESRLNYVEHRASLTTVNAGLENSPHNERSARLAYRRRFAGPLVLVPTRESAIRIASDAQKITTHHQDFEVQLLVGGTEKAQDMKDWMESSRDLVIATPGRLRDLLTNEPDFRQGFKCCPMLILDEVDMLLSMGFRDDIDAIVSFLPRIPDRQTFLFSASMGRAVRQLASWILSPNYTFINATPAEPSFTPRRGEEPKAYTEFVMAYDKPTTHNHIEQFCTVCPASSDQLPTLLKLLVQDQFLHGSRSKVIVLCPTAQTAELFSTVLHSLAAGVLPDDTTEIVTMHSKMKQSDRERTRALFHKTGKTHNGRPIILVGSGISTKGATRLIQIGVPNKETEYVHRIRGIARSIGSLGKGRENDRPVMRVDLLLLPWEAGYMNWQLADHPIKSFPISVLDDHLSTLCPQASNLITESMGASLAEVQRRIDPAHVHKTAASLLGYYLPLTPSLRLQPKAVIAGVSSWASECFNVSIPTITRLPRIFTEAYVQSAPSKKTKGLFADSLKLAGPSALGMAKSKNRSVWEGANTRRKKPKRWY